MLYLIIVVLSVFFVYIFFYICHARPDAIPPPRYHSPTGLVRDLTGSYLISMWCLTGLVMIGFLLWLCMPSQPPQQAEQELEL